MLDDSKEAWLGPMHRIKIWSAIWKGELGSM